MYKFGAQGSADQVSGEIKQLMKRGEGKRIGAVAEDNKSPQVRAAHIRRN